MVHLTFAICFAAFHFRTTAGANLRPSKAGFYALPKTVPEVSSEHKEEPESYAENRPIGLKNKWDGWPTFFEDEFSCRVYKTDQDGCVGSHVFAKNASEECKQYAIDRAEPSIARRVWRATPLEMQMQPSDMVEKLFSLENNTALILFGDSLMNIQQRSLACILEKGGAQHVSQMRAEELRGPLPKVLSRCELYIYEKKWLTLCHNEWTESFSTILDSPILKQPAKSWLLGPHTGAHEPKRVILLNGVGVYYKTQAEYGKAVSAFKHKWTSTVAQNFQNGVPTLVMRDIPPQHRPSDLGETDGEEDDVHCLPEGDDLLRKATFDMVFDDSRIRTLNIFKVTKNMTFSHPQKELKRKDCLHYSFPVGYVWNAALANLWPTL